MQEEAKQIITRVLARGIPANPKQRMIRGRGSPNAVNDPVPVPGEKKKRKLTRKEWRQEYQKALRADPGFGKALKRLPPRHAALLVAWATNGNNIQRAAVQLGYSTTTAKKIFSTEAFREARLLIEAFIPEEDKEWLEILPEARHTLRTLMKSSDEKVRYLAAKDIADRAEGKAITRVDMQIRDEVPSMTDAEMQLAFSIMQQLGKGFAETRAWMLAHPDEVKHWIEHNTAPPVNQIESTEKGLVVKKGRKSLLSAIIPDPHGSIPEAEIVDSRPPSGPLKPTLIVELL